MFGKLAANALNLLHGILALIPLLGIAVLLGGVTGTEFSRMTLVLINSLWVALSIGIWVSARSRSDQKAVWSTVVLIGLLSGFTFLIDSALTRGKFQLAGGLFSVLSPAYACIMAFETNYLSGPGRFWFSLASTHIAAWCLLVAASRGIAHRWGEDVVVSRGARLWDRWDRWSRGIVVHPRLWRQQLLDLNPVLWVNDRYRRDRAWLLAVLFSLVFWFAVFQLEKPTPGAPGGPLGLIMSGSGLITLLLLVLMASHASRFFVEGRRTGTLELLLTTPLSQDAILEGQRQMCTRRVVWSVLLVLIWKATNLFRQLSLIATSSKVILAGGVQFEFRRYLFLNSTAELLIFTTSLYALTWVGMWMGLAARKPTQAATRAFVYVLVIPWFAMGFTSIFLIKAVGLWYSVVTPGLFVIKDLAFARWARKNLKQDLRLTASRGLSLEPSGRPWRQLLRRLRPLRYG